MYMGDKTLYNGSIRPTIEWAERDNDPSEQRLKKNHYSLKVEA